MELIGLKNKTIALCKKYKLPILIILIGFLLLMMPEIKIQKNDASESRITTENIPFEESLSNILSMIQGAGEVKVVLTVLEGEEVLYQEDGNYSDSEENSEKRTSTVIITDSERIEAGLIRQVKPPVYRGAIVVCQGADDPSVKLAIVEAVSRVTGIGTNCISVLKME